jgi:DNA-binding NarL/FixJ family response regulator
MPSEPQFPAPRAEERVVGTLVVLDRVRRDRRHPPAAASSTARVLIADGRALVRAGYRALLELPPRTRVVGEAATGEDAVALARRIRADVVVIDVALPGLGCVEATRQLLSEPAVPVLVLTAACDDERTFAALRAGARGALVKDCEPAELVRAVEALARGDAALSPSLTRRLITEFTAVTEPAAPDEELVSELTAREREVVALVALGLRNDEIAERLVVSSATARTHVSRAMMKVHAHTRAQLVVFAYEVGLTRCA